MRRVTQKDVAQAVGMSQATVALVVGDANSPLRKRLRKETVRRIEAKVKELGYQPNQAAQAMRRGRSNMILHLSCGGYSELALQESYQIGRFVHEAGFDYQVIDSYYWPGDGEQIVRRVLSAMPEGVILSGSPQTEIDFSPLHEAEVPMVAIKTPEPDIPVVRCDDGGAIAELTRFCLEQRRIPVVLLRENHSPAMLRRRGGFQKALRAQGIGEVKEWSSEDLLQAGGVGQAPAIIYDSEKIDQFNLFSGGMRVGQRLLAAGWVPEALVCSNDHYAIGVLTVLLKAGIRVPQETLVTGYDNLSFATQGIISLTTVEQPIEAMSAAAVDLLLQRIKEKSGVKLPVAIDNRKKREALPDGWRSQDQMVLPCRIHWRESTGPPPAPTSKASPSSQKDVKGLAQKHGAAAMTLIQILVAIAIISVLAVLSLGAGKSVRQRSMNAACQANLRTMGVALHAYAADHNGILVDAAALRRGSSKDDLGDYWYGALQPYVDGGYVPSSNPSRPKWQLCPAKKIPRDAGFSDTQYAEGVIGYGWVYQSFENSDGTRTGGFGYVTGEGSQGYVAEGVNTRLAAVEKPAETIIIGDSLDAGQVKPGNAYQSRYLYKNEAYAPFAQRHSGGGNYLFVDGHIETLTPDQLKARLPEIFKVRKDPKIW